MKILINVLTVLALLLGAIFVLLAVINNPARAEVIIRVTEHERSVIMFNDPSNHEDRISSAAATALGLDMDSSDWR